MRKRRVEFTVTEEEWSGLERAAGMEERSVAAYVRKAAMVAVGAVRVEEPSARSAVPVVDAPAPARVVPVVPGPVPAMPVVAVPPKPRDILKELSELDARNAAGYGR